MTTSKTPLSGLKVIDLSSVLAGPNCARYLADFGADVIKVEPPQGDYGRRMTWPIVDGVSLLFLHVSRGKRSIVLDLRTDEGKAAFLELVRDADAVVEAMRSFAGRPQELWLPSAPQPPLVVMEQENRPQPRLDADLGGGMAVAIGRIRECPVMHTKFVALGHNTVRGAAGAAILNAELMHAEGMLQ